MSSLESAIREAIAAGLEVTIRSEDDQTFCVDLMIPEYGGDGDYQGAAHFASWTDEAWWNVPDLIVDGAREYAEEKRHA